MPSFVLLNQNTTCGLKGHKVTTCRKLPRAQELIKQDKQQY